MPKTTPIFIQGHCKLPRIRLVISKIESAVQINGEATETCDPPNKLTAKREGHAIYFEDIPCSGCRYHGHNLR